MGDNRDKKWCDDVLGALASDNEAADEGEAGPEPLFVDSQGLADSFFDLFRSKGDIVFNLDDSGFLQLIANWDTLRGVRDIPDTLPAFLKTGLRVNKKTRRTQFVLRRRFHDEVKELQKPGNWRVPVGAGIYQAVPGNPNPEHAATI